MRLIKTHCIAGGIAGLVLAIATSALAGPGTAEMAIAESPVAVVPARTMSSAEADDAYDSAGLGSGSAKDLFSTADDISPSDSTPMIPLPPAVWAGFAGLAFVARRVLRQSGSRRS